MIERAITFGRSHTLVGIVNEPGENKGAETLPAVILVNAGLLNRSGPHRLYVTLARTLAERGFLSLRFDHSGLGDSDTRPDHLTYAAGVVSDTRLAMDYLEETYGVESFVLGGLCSGRTTRSLRLAQMIGWREPCFWTGLPTEPRGII